MVYCPERVQLKEVNVDVNLATPENKIILKTNDFRLTGPINGDLSVSFPFTNLTNETFFHNFGSVNKYPSVTVVDENDYLVIVAVHYLSPNAVRLISNQPFNGTVHFN